jgi:hypothetical protein
MYPRIRWELVADPLGSTEYTFGTTDMECRPRAASYIAVP